MINDSQIKVSYTLTQAGQVLPVPFYFLENGHLLVSKNGDPLEIGTDYNVSGAGNESGGTVTMIGGVDGDSVFIIREVPESQLTEYRYNERFPSESMERSLDKLTMITQQNADRSSRSIRIPADESTQTILPAAAERADKILVFDADGNVDPRTTDEVVGPVVEEVEELVNEAKGYRNESSGFASAAKESEENADESAEQALEQADRAKGYADGIEEAIALKADLDPDTGRLVDEQLPEAIEAKILLRFGTRSELDNAIPPLAENEPAYETDTGFYRLGATRYPNLAFMQAELNAIDASQITSGRLDAARLPTNVMLQNEYHPGYAGQYPFLYGISVLDSPNLSAVAGRFGVSVDYDGMTETTVDIYGSVNYGLRFYVPAGSGEAYLVRNDQREGLENNLYHFPNESGRLLTDNSPLPAANLTGEVADARIPASIARSADVTQANANIDALRREVDLDKQPQGGVYTQSAGYVEIPTLSIDSLSLGGTRSFTLAWKGRPIASNGLTGHNYNQLFGNVRGASPEMAGGAGLCISNIGGTFTGVPAFLFATGNMRPTNFNRLGVESCFLVTVNATTKQASLYVDGVLILTADVSSATFNRVDPMRVMSNVGYNAYMTGHTNAATAWSKELSADEIAAYVKSGGKIIPVSSRSECEVHLVFDEGAGYQVRDRSGKGNHGLLTETGCTHLLSRNTFEFSWTRISSGFLGDADRPVLPPNAVIESIIWEDAKGTKTTASLGYNASNPDTHVASFTPTQSRQPATLAAGSMVVADRRLYLDMGANAGAVTVRVKGRIL